MKRIRASILITVLASAAVVAVAVAQDRTPPRVPGVDVSGMDLSVRPQDDFLRYVNGKGVDTASPWLLARPRR